MKRRISLFLAIILIFTMGLSGCKKKEEVKVEEKLITVETQKVELKDILIKTTLSGKVTPIEEANVKPKMPGKVVKTNNLEIGKRVNKGEVLFTLDQTDLLNGVKIAEAAYNSSIASMKQTEEMVNNAKINYERMKSLYNEGAISKQQFEQAELSASSSGLDAQRALAEQARVALENARASLADTTVVSPLSGVITYVDINEGEMASSGDPAVTIASLDKVIVEVNLSENLINKVKIGDLVDVSIKSANKDFKGKITALASATSGESMTYPIKIEIDNKDKVIKPGMFSDINIITDKKEKVLAIASEAPLVKEGNTVVFTVNEGKAFMNKVSLGMDNGQYVEITKGLKEGDIVVTKGQNYLDEKSKVKEKK